MCTREKGPGKLAPYGILGLRGQADTSLEWAVSSQKMLPGLPFAVVMALAVALVLRGERTGPRSLVYVFKPLASVMFVALGLLLYEPPNPPGAWILAALTLCLVGDVLLMLPHGLLPGLVAFLLAHVAYIAAFHSLAPAQTWPVAFAAPVVAVSALAAHLLWPHLGKMRAPVLAYITAITVMVWAAASVFAAGEAGWRTLTGAVLFYFSDLAVARDRFVHKRFVDRIWGLPAYYAGQLLLALSVVR